MAVPGMLRASIDKAKLRAKLLEIEYESTKEAEGEYNAHLEGARPDLNETTDQGQRSQEEQSGVEAHRFEEQVHLHQGHRTLIETLDFGPTEVVRPGALVKVNDRYFVIAVPAPILRIGGIEISGISSDSPLFQAMEGLRAGNEFEWNGQIVAVKEVY
jgi:hypothetical protein